MRTIVIDANYQVLVKPGGKPTVFHDSSLTQGVDAERLHQLHLGTPGGDLTVVQLDADLPSELPGFELASLRSLLVPLEESAFQWLGRGIQLCRWQTEHRFCGKCGSPTEPSATDEALVCPSCELSFYPKISPCVIGLIEDGDHCLLARGARHPEAMFSTIAGFIEAGENAEQAFVREVQEEVGVAVRDITYLYSQPWPFPGQLMLGFTANFAGGDICVDGEEILEAHWYHYDQLPLIPPDSTISGRIIRDFVRRKQFATP
ncbi:NAD(+) diphosphatase [Teredinibacter turnerae]|uniref:NAD(+) diphosphatase n=1 Tax=Teredinibacter turnerae TaxID=2426 RepID=UPI000A9733ED|nr:NAD(+) diphosphatase [Teredinibacter turnerae]